MRMASMPIAVVMQRRSIHHRWSQDAWAAIAVVPDPGGLEPVHPLASTDERDVYLVPGLRLDLYPDEIDGYFENWAAPEPKVFVLWRMRDGRALPLQASVSYAEGTRMFDSGDSADGVLMPAEIHAWLAGFLQKHYEPRPGRGRQHG
jgi:hypothetical protein